MGDYRAPVAVVAALSLALCAVFLAAVPYRRGQDPRTTLLDKYDYPYRDDGLNDMADHSMGRTMSYSEGDRDVREAKYMRNKFDRLQNILNSIHNGPTGAPLPPPPPPPAHNRKGTKENIPKCGERGGKGCPKPKPKKILSYTERILRRINELQLRVNEAARRQYNLEDKVRKQIAILKSKHAGHILCFATSLNATYQASQRSSSVACSALITMHHTRNTAARSFFLYHLLCVRIVSWYRTAHTSKRR
jgi:hypothetical protein